MVHLHVHVPRHGGDKGAKERCAHGGSFNLDRLQACLQAMLTWVHSSKW